MRTPIIAALLLPLLPAVAAGKDCSGANTQLEINECAAAEAKKADADLNLAYSKLTKKVSEAGKAKLVEAQRAWIKWRDAQCAFDTLGTIDGSIHPLEVAVCEQELTKLQTQRLNRHLDCEEGDPSCGGQ